MIKSKVKDLKGLISRSIIGDFEIIDEKIDFLTAPGEHYGSVMLAVELKIRKANGNDEILHLVAKLPPVNEVLRTAFDIPVTFKKEVFAYTVMVPALVEFQNDHGLIDDDIGILFPKCYGARVSLDENKNVVDDDGVLIFENLKIQGFRTEDRLVGFDYEATTLILKDLAKFHAVPLALKLLKPDVFENCVMPALEKNKGLEQLPEEVGLAFHNSIMEGAYENPELKPYWERLKKVTDYAAVHPYVNRPPPNEDYGTMSHSDFWVSNTMLLKDADGRPIKNKIVDLQLMTYSSAIRDLVFFLFTSVVNSILENHYKEFIRLYYDEFVGILRKFGVDLTRYDWDSFNKELEEVAPTEVYHILVMLKPICTERGKVNNSLEDFQDSDWSRKDLLGPSHRRKLKDTVLQLAKLNWI